MGLRIAHIASIVFDVKLTYLNEFYLVQMYLIGLYCPFFIQIPAIFVHLRTLIKYVLREGIKDIVKVLMLGGYNLIIVCWLLGYGDLFSALWINISFAVYCIGILMHCDPNTICLC